MKVSELSGTLLDYWVARAEGNLTSQSTSPSDSMVEHYGAGGEIDGRSPLSSWAPSENWDTGGPLIERERIGVLPCGREWRAWASEDMDPSGTGETPLIAAMRAYVASKFGTEVPDAGSILKRDENA